MDTFDFKIRYYILLNLVKNKALKKYNKRARKVVELSIEIFKTLESINTKNFHETLKKYLNIVYQACEEFEEFCILIPSLQILSREKERKNL